MSSERVSLYIPMGVKTESEFFAGFGRKQLLQSAIGTAGAVVIALFLWLTTQSIATTVITVLGGVAGSVMMTTKDHTNLSVVDQLSNMVRFIKGQKFYQYRYGKEWGEF